MGRCRDKIEKTGGRPSCAAFAVNRSIGGSGMEGTTRCARWESRSRSLRPKLVIQRAPRNKARFDQTHKTGLGIAHYAIDSMVMGQTSEPIKSRVGHWGGIYQLCPGT